MKIRTVSVIAATSLVALVYFALTVTGRASAATPLKTLPARTASVPLDAVPEYLRSGAKVGWLNPTNEFRAVARYSAALKRVTIEWSAANASTGVEELATPLRPTALAYLGNRQLCVSGLDEDGDTVVEVWTIRDPMKLISISSGRAVIHGKGTSRRGTLMEDDIPGRRIVRNMIPLLDSSDGVILQFHDSGDVYQVTLVGAQFNLIASPDPASAADYIPSLTSLRTGYWSGRHLSRGYCYFLGGLDQTTNIKVFIDSDADGSIDQTEVHGMSTLVSSGLADPDQFY